MERLASPSERSFGYPATEVCSVWDAKKVGDAKKKNETPWKIKPEDRFMSTILIGRTIIYYVCRGQSVFLREIFMGIWSILHLWWWVSFVFCFPMFWNRKDLCCLMSRNTSFVPASPGLESYPYYLLPLWTWEIT